MITESRSVLLTGGRSFVALDLARQFARAGHRVIMAESVLIHLCRYSRCIEKTYLVPPPNTQTGAYLEALLEIVRSEHIDLLLPTCEEIFFIAGGLARLQACCEVFTEPLERLLSRHSKWEFSQRALQYNLAVPETYVFTSLQALQAFLREERRPFVLKPVFSRFAANVLFVNGPGQDLSRLTISYDYPWIAQKRISGQAYCSYSLAKEGKVLATALYTETFTAGLGTCIHFAQVEHAGIEAWIRRFVEQEHVSGQIAFDFMVTAQGEVFALECNPRSTSGLHLFQHNLLPPLFLRKGDCDEQPPLKPHSNSKAMIAPAMLVYGLPSALRSWTRLRSWFRCFFSTRDVIFDLRDLKPFLFQPVILWFNWRNSRQAGLSLQAFSTSDIEWNGQDMRIQDAMI